MFEDSSILKYAAVLFHMFNKETQPLSVGILLKIFIVCILFVYHSLVLNLGNKITITDLNARYSKHF